VTVEKESPKNLQLLLIICLMAALKAGQYLSLYNILNISMLIN